MVNSDPVFLSQIPRRAVPAEGEPLLFGSLPARRQLFRPVHQPWIRLPVLRKLLRNQLPSGNILAGKFFFLKTFSPIHHEPIPFADLSRLGQRTDDHHHKLRDGFVPQRRHLQLIPQQSNRVPLPGRLQRTALRPGRLDQLHIHRQECGRFHRIVADLLPERSLPEQRLVHGSR